jgi:hypothetical protein
MVVLKLFRLLIQSIITTDVGHFFLCLCQYFTLPIVYCLFSRGVTSWDETGQCCHLALQYPFFLFSEVKLGASWFLYVSTISVVTYAQRLQDLYSACLMFWMRTHTGPRFIVSSEGRESHQLQVIGRFRHTHKPKRAKNEPRTSRIGGGRSAAFAPQTARLLAYLFLLLWMLMGLYFFNCRSVQCSFSVVKKIA